MDAALMCEQLPRSETIAMHYYPISSIILQWIFQPKETLILVEI